MPQSPSRLSVLSPSYAVFTSTPAEVVRPDTPSRGQARARGRAELLSRICHWSQPAGSDRYGRAWIPQHPTMAGRLSLPLC